MQHEDGLLGGKRVGLVRVLLEAVAIWTRTITEEPSSLHARRAISKELPGISRFPSCCAVQGRAQDTPTGEVEVRGQSDRETSLG